MSTGKRALVNSVLWLLPGLAAGMLLAAVLSYHEYLSMAEIAGFVIRADSVSEDTGTLSEIFARSLKESEKHPSGSLTILRDGKEFLGLYGYRPMRSWGVYLPYTAAVSILFFQIAGWIVFGVRRREELRVKNRILELTEYLKSVNLGEGAILCRNEDDFSRLEDEMYKTVMELQCTKEAALEGHEILAERIADIAHQLKTPLTSMSLMTELLEEYQTARTREYYSRLSVQIERLKNLVSGLLALAKLDSHGIVFCKERIAVTELVESVSESLREMMAARQITVAVEGYIPGNMYQDKAEYKTEGSIAESGQYAAETECFIYADRQWTEEALLNILKNCVEHTPDGGRIRVSFGRNPIYVELRMEDGGSGFAAKDLPHIFERFYRGEGAAKDNAGIGLALAKAVLEEQNGYLYAENSADGHACFRIKWYA